MKKVLFLLLAFMVTLAVNAQQVSRLQALQKAQQFMPGKQFGQAKSFARGEKSTDMEPFYIFNAKGQKGFVIVSGDDRTEPILGYSEKGEISEKNMPENLKYWLECYEIQMKSLDQDKAAGSRGATQSASKAAVAPLIQSKWDQGEPYNYMCPSAEVQEVDGEVSFTYADYDEVGYNPNQRCVTGCVATAMAQVMRYWEWPASCGAIGDINIGEWVNQGTDENPDWQFVVDHSFHGLEGTLFDWNNMSLTYSSSEPEESASAKAVSTLMRYCGQAVNMDYGLGVYGGSGANVYASDMVNTFGYSKNAKDVNRYLFTVADWENLIYNELSNGRPVLYGGSSASGGHQFICDGYDGNGLFHFNWGWSGSSDGYFVLSLANPQDLGSGGGTNTDGYSYRQDAIIGLQKPVGEDVETPDIYSLIWDDESLNTPYSRSSSAENFENISLSGLILMYYNFAEKGAWSDYSIDYAWGLYQDGVLVNVYGETSATLTDENFYVDNNAIVGFGAGLADGTYMLRQICRPQGSENWSPCLMRSSSYLDVMSYIKATISGNTLTLKKANDYEYFSTDIQVNSVTYSPSSLEAGKAVEMTVNFTNNGDGFQELICLRVNNQYVTIVCGSVEPGQTGTVKLHFVPYIYGEGIPLMITAEGSGSKILWEDALDIEYPKQQSLTATATISGFDDSYSGVLRGTTLNLMEHVQNVGENTYDNQISFYLIEKDPETNDRSLFAMKSVMATIEPGNTKDMTFTITGLNPDKHYYYYMTYYSSGSEDILYDDYWCTYLFSLLAPTTIQGDADGSGGVDVNDVNAIVSYIMGVEPENFVFSGADANTDGKVNAVDLVLVNKILHP